MMKIAPSSFSRAADSIAWGIVSVVLAVVSAAEVPVEFVIHERGIDPPLPCRIHLKNSAGQPVRAPGLPFFRDHFVCPGQVALRLPPGDYAYEIERGPEYSAASGRVTAAEGRPLGVTNELFRLANLAAEGWWSGDLHVHRPLADIELLMRAEDLHIAPVITWWNNTNPWSNNVPGDLLRRFDGDRYYELLGGEDERGGGALLYFGLRSPLPITGSKREHPSPMAFLRQARSSQGVWVDIEKPFWWDAPVWAASGLANSIGIAQNHMNRGGMLDNEAWGKPRDLQRYPGAHGNGLWTQDIYYHLLNCGLRLPPSAGSASGVLPNPVGYNRAYVQVEGELTWDKWWDGLRAGRVFVSNGPLLRCKANSQWPGHVFRSNGPLRVDFDLELAGREPLARLELVRNGRIEPLTPNSPLIISEGGWFLVRAIAAVTNTFRFASTGPFYVELNGARAAPRPESLTFFQNWLRERIVFLENSETLVAEEKKQIIAPLIEARQFYENKLASQTSPSFTSAAVIPAPGQPLAAQANRVLQSLEMLGAPLSDSIRDLLRQAIADQDSARIQNILDPEALFVVTVNPESRVRVARGPGSASLQQSGWTPVLVKVINQGTLTKELRITSPQAGQVYAGMTPLSAQRMQRGHLKETQLQQAQPARFLDLAMYANPPMAASLSGLEVEYALALIYSQAAGRLEATMSFDVGQGEQDLGFRGEVPVLFDVRPAVSTILRVRDQDGQPAAARLVFRDATGRVHPPQAKRLAPDFYFQEQIYRRDGQTVLLPPGRLSMASSRGPEYHVRKQEILIPGSGPKAPIIEVRLQRWINPADYGFYSGDHHIHGAGCAHYTSPTEGVKPEDIFLQIDGEGLNVGCVLTWGPCFDYQRRFFSPGIHTLSQPLTVLKYDLEISGFGSEALGHVCLLNLRDQEYPGSGGSKAQGWPKWTTPVMRWAKQQGGYTGYAHSGSGLEIHAVNASRRLIAEFDANQDRLLTSSEAASALLPDPFEVIDSDRDGALIETELVISHNRVAEQLPNLAVPEMNGVGAMEICVSTAAGVCDFISAMDTPRIAEWNMWYHILNCGFPLKVSGETDFPCMSGDRVGQGRVYVQLGKVKRLEFAAWCEGLAAGRSYVSDGFAHALEFSVQGRTPGTGDVKLARPGSVVVKAKVAFAPEQPLSVAQGGLVPPGGKRWIGDTVTLHGPRTATIRNGGVRLVEIVINGRAVASKEVAADGAVHDLDFMVPIERSSWVALRHFPQLHSNPVNVLVDGTPIRASAASARWCIETIRQLWSQRQHLIPEGERAEARREFDAAISKYQSIAGKALD